MTTPIRVGTIPRRTDIELYVNNHGALPLYIRLVLGAFVKHGWTVDSGSFVVGGGNWFADLRKGKTAMDFGYLPSKAAPYVLSGKGMCLPFTTQFGSLKALEEYLATH